jgi:hypothetical protein
MKKALVVLWNITLLACMTILAGSCSPSLTSQIRAMERAHNLHQLDKELSFYADDARFETDDWTVQRNDHHARIQPRLTQGDNPSGKICGEHR